MCIGEKYLRAFDELKLHMLVDFQTLREPKGHIPE